MIGIYFSGTGNTKYCVRCFLNRTEEDIKMYPIENSEKAHKALIENEDILLAYPIHYSNAPKIMQDFIYKNRRCFAGKRVFIMATMGLFSGDGAGCAARMLKKYGAVITGGVHIKMPDNISDVAMLKKSREENIRIIDEAREKIKEAAENFKNGNPPKEGLSVINRIAGLLGQRLWFYNKTRKYNKIVNINGDLCVRCGMCVANCPMHNLHISNEKAISRGKCTMCYRCVSNCPRMAITIIGKEVVSQYNINQYTGGEEDA